MKCRLGFVAALIAAIAISLVAEAAQKKIIYFTAGSQPTTAEKAAIAKLNAQAAAPYVVRVRNSREARLRGTRESTDYVAGAIPPNYRDGGVDGGTSLYTVYDPTNPVLPDPFKRD